MRVVVYFLLALAVCEGVDNKVASDSIKSDCNCTVYEHSLEKVLSRHKRWFVFPKDCNIGITLSILKAILEDRPPGMRLILELTIAYSIPTLLEGFRIDKFFLGKSVVPEKPAPKANRRLFVNSTSEQYTRTPPMEGFARPPPRPWSHNRREYRERRQIFKKIEELGKHFEINSKACIMRAMCEVKNGLLPEGRSFIQDVARIIFTFPENYDGEYLLDDSDGKVNCARKFSVSCPFSPLAYLMLNSRQALKDWKKGH